MTRLVIKLLNYTTVISNFTQSVRHWLPWPCFYVHLRRTKFSLFIIFYWRIGDGRWWYPTENLDYNEIQYISPTSLNDLPNRVLWITHPTQSHYPGTSQIIRTGQSQRLYRGILYLSDQWIVISPPNRNRIRFTEPTTVRIGIGIVCESQNLRIDIGIIFIRWELFANYSQISEIFFSRIYYFNNFFFLTLIYFSFEKLTGQRNPKWNICPLSIYILYTIHYAYYTICFIIYNLHYTLYTIHYTLYTIHYTLYTIHYALYTKRLYHFTTIRLYNCTTIQLYNYTTIKLYNYTTIWLYDYTTILLYDYMTLRLCNYTTIQLYNYMTIQLYNPIHPFSLANSLEPWVS